LIFQFQAVELEQTHHLHQPRGQRLFLLDPYLQTG